jgi:hypothetical protein
VNLSYAPFNEHQSIEGNNVQTKAFPMYLALKNLNFFEVEANEGVDPSTTILHVGKFIVMYIKILKTWDLTLAPKALR